VFAYLLPSVVKDAYELFFWYEGEEVSNVRHDLRDVSFAFRGFVLGLEASCSLFFCLGRSFGELAEMVLNDGYSDVVLGTMSVAVPLASLIYDGARKVVTCAVGMMAKLIGLRMRRP